MKAPERMTLRELLAAQARIAQAIVRARQSEREALVHEMHGIAAAHGFSVRELFDGGAGRRA